MLTTAMEMPEQKKKQVLTQLEKNKIAALKEYEHFKKTGAELLHTPDYLRNNAPNLFEFVPAELWSAIASLADYQYGELAPQELKNLSTRRNRAEYVPFRWTALGYHFNVIPYHSNNGYFHFDKNQSNQSILKGIRDKDASLGKYLQLLDSYGKLMRDKEQTDDEMTIFEHELAAAKKSKENIEGPYIQELQENVKNSKSIARYLGGQLQLTQENLKKQLDQLTTQYTINLMPYDRDLTPIIIKLLRALKDDAELQGLINSFKVMIDGDYNKPELLNPRVVIYPAQGKENTQKALNKLATIFANTKGLPNRKLLYHAKVNDLIWIAQGDSRYKGNEYAIYYEHPNRVYYHPNTTGTLHDYHLKFPGTDKDII